MFFSIFKSSNGFFLKAFSKKISIAFIIAIFFAGCGQTGFQTVPTKIENFEGNTVEGEVSSYNKEKGKATLIVISASWCSACNSELPAIKQIGKEYESNGLKILVVNEDDDIETAARYKKAKNIQWTMLHWNYDMMNKLGNPGVIPVHYLVDANDSIQRIDVGVLNQSKVKHELNRLLKPQDSGTK